MKYDEQNVFARILRNELPSERVYEDEHTVAFVDLMTRTEGRTLMVPREPAITLLDLSADAAVACMRTVKIVAPAVKQAVTPTTGRCYRSWPQYLYSNTRLRTLHSMSSSIFNSSSR